MTTTPPTRTSTLTRSSALLWTTGGIAWLLAGLIASARLEPLWILADVLLLGGRSLLFIDGRRTGTWLPTRPATVGLGIAIGARLAFIVGEILDILSGTDDNAFLAVGAMGTAIGLTMFGIAVARRRSDAGPARLAPLLAGLYPFVAMFPILAITGEPPEIAIALWGVPLGLVGTAIAAANRRVHPTPTLPRVERRDPPLPSPIGSTGQR